MDAPNLKIEKEPIDWVIEAIALVALLILIIVPLHYYSALPETIPIHFNLQGEPDNFGNKKMIWFLPAVGVFVYLLLSVVNKRPSTFNHPVKITKENALNQYKSATKMLRWLKMIITSFFAIMIYEMIQLSLGNPSSLGKVIPLFLISIFSVIGYSLYQSFSKK